MAVVGVSIGGEVCWGGILKIGKRRFCLWNHNLLCYVKVDGTADSACQIGLELTLQNFLEGGSGFTEWKKR